MYCRPPLHHLPGQRPLLAWHGGGRWWPEGWACQCFQDRRLRAIIGRVPCEGWRGCPLHRLGGSIEVLSSVSGRKRLCVLLLLRLHLGVGVAIPRAMEVVVVVSKMAWIGGCPQWWAAPVWFVVQPLCGCFCLFLVFPENLFVRQMLLMNSAREQLGEVRLSRYLMGP